MSRTEKMQRTLADYQHEYFALAKEELEQAAHGGASAMESAFFTWGKQRDTSKQERLDWLAGRITQIRRKLGEPSDVSVVEIVERFKRRYRDLGTSQRHHEWVRLSRAALAELAAAMGSALF